MNYSKTIIFVVGITAICLCTGCSGVINTGNESVKIITNPSGANIFLDNKLAGKTPFTITMCKDEDHTILLRKEGYETRLLKFECYVSGGWAVADIILFPLFLFSAAIVLALAGGGNSASGIGDCMAINWYELDIENNEIKIDLEPKK